MEEISKKVTVDEMQYGGIFVVQQGNMLVISAKGPDWVRSPLDGERKYIRNRWVSQLDIKCPKCGSTDRHGIVELEEGLIVICCKSCKEFVWCRIDIED